jgi:hypothetical protein
MGPPASDVPGGETATALTRQLVHDDGALQIWRAVKPPGLILAGEIDEASYPALVGQLARLSLDGPEVHVTMADVVYCDLAGLRALVSLGAPPDGNDGPPPAPSRRLILHELPVHLEAVLHIVGWDITPGLVIIR